MRALVTGACGFVGKHLVAHLLAKGDEVVATDLAGLSWAADVPGFPNGTFRSERLSHEALDAADSEACQRIITHYKPDAIYHLAGISFVPEAEENFDKALRVNVGAVNNIVRTCHLLDSKTRVLIVSSAEVYGRMALSELPLTEKTSLLPANSYSLSKSMAELVARRYAQFDKVFPIVVRPFNHIGPGQNNRFVVPSFASQLAEIAHGRSEPVIKVGNLEAERDFTDVRDIVRAYRMAVENRQKKQDECLFNLCSGNPVSIQHILDTLIKISGVHVKVEQDPTRMRPSEVPRIYGSYEKAKRQIGWEPEISFDDTLRDTYQYYYSLQA